MTTKDSNERTGRDLVDGSHRGPLRCGRRRGPTTLQQRRLALRNAISKRWTTRSQTRRATVGAITVRHSANRGRTRSAPALAAATVGIAMGTDDVTSQAAGAVVMDSRRTRRRTVPHRSANAVDRAAAAGRAWPPALLGMGFAQLVFCHRGGALLQEAIDVVAVVNALRMTWHTGPLSDYGDRPLIRRLRDGRSTAGQPGRHPCRSTDLIDRRRRDREGGLDLPLAPPRRRPRRQVLAVVDDGQ